MSSVVTMATSSTAEDDTAQRGTEEEEEAEPAELERGRMTPDYSSEGERSAYNESTADSFDSSTREEDSSVEAFPSMAPKARNNLQEVEELVKQETMQVKQWRFIVFVLVRNVHCIVRNSREKCSLSSCLANSVLVLVFVVGNTHTVSRRSVSLVQWWPPFWTCRLHA